MEEVEARKMREHLFVGLILIAVGSVLLADRLGYGQLESFLGLGPAIIALHGALTLVFARRAKQIVKGVFEVLLASWVFACLEHLWGWTFASTWPIAIIAGGAAVLLRGLLGLSRHIGEEEKP
jgi:hypothetical protein